MMLRCQMFLSQYESDFCTPFATETKQILEVQKSEGKKRLQTCQMLAVINRYDNTKHRKGKRETVGIEMKYILTFHFAVAGGKHDSGD